MFFAGGGAEMRNAAFLRVTEESGRCFMREYGGERAVRYEGIRKGSGGEEIAAWRQVATMGR